MDIVRQCEMGMVGVGRGYPLSRTRYVMLPLVMLRLSAAVSLRLMRRMSDMSAGAMLLVWIAHVPLQSIRGFSRRS